MNQTFEKKIDLHSHSLCSDGTETPTALVINAKRAGLSALALTDHDTIDGLEEFLEAGKKNNFEALPGIELATTYYDGLEIHIIGLFIDPSSPVLLKKLISISQSRQKRNRKMCEKITSLGFPISYEEIQKEAGGEIITRAHFGKFMEKKKYVSSKSEAFRKYLSPGLPGYVEREIFLPEEAISLIHQSGGLAVLAHPSLYNLGFELEKLFQYLVEHQIDAVETRYSTYTKKEQKEITYLTKKYRLKQSGGSDFHGTNKADIRLGVGKGNLFVPYEFLDQLRS